VTPPKNKRHPLAVQKIATARTPHPTGSAYVPAAEKNPDGLKRRTPG
jgi:hypothetical protein